MHTTHRTYAYIDLDAIRHNYSVIRTQFPEQKVMSVLKADAYGHGVTGILPACDENTDYYAVATFDEFKAIRQWGSRKPVLLFGLLPLGLVEEAARLGMTFSVGNVEYARKLCAILGAAGLTADCHVKIDTGMNRTGIRWRAGQEAAAREALKEIFTMKELRVTGTFTHMGCADSEEASDLEFTKLQFDRFCAALQAISDMGFDPGIRHCCATGGSFIHPDYRLDMVRTGMMVYGQSDSLAHYRQLGQKQAIRWCSHIVDISPLPAGEAVSYGRTFVADRDMTVGVVSCGYADGFRRCYQNWGWVLVGGKRVRILGRICMDFMLVDLTDLPDTAIGAEVVLLGTQGEDEITPMEIAAAVTSTCGEVTAAITQRVRKYYVNQ